MLAAKQVHTLDENWRLHNVVNHEQLETLSLVIKVTEARPLADLVKVFGLITIF